MTVCLAGETWCSNIHFPMSSIDCHVIVVSFLYRYAVTSVEHVKPRVNNGRGEEIIKRAIFPYTYARSINLDLQRLVM